MSYNKINIPSEWPEKGLPPPSRRFHGKGTASYIQLHSQPRQCIYRCEVAASHGSAHGGSMCMTSETSNLKVNPGKETRRQTCTQECDSPILAYFATKPWGLPNQELENYWSSESKPLEEDQLGLSQNPTMFPMAKATDSSTSIHFPSGQVTLQFFKKLDIAEYRANCQF